LYSAPVAVLRGRIDADDPGPLAPAAEQAPASKSTNRIATENETVRFMIARL
jgi:hypothetical protein